MSTEQIPEGTTLNSTTTEAPAPQQPEQTQQPDRVSFSLEEWEAELARAEQKGYVRGRNESIDNLMTPPRSLTRQAIAAGDDNIAPDDPADNFLRFVRPSIWD